jgi:hypothetical protein
LFEHCHQSANQRGPGKGVIVEEQVVVMRRAGVSVIREHEVHPPCEAEILPRGNGLNSVINPCRSNLVEDSLQLCGGMIRARVVQDVGSLYILAGKRHEALFCLFSPIIVKNDGADALALRSQWLMNFLSSASGGEIRHYCSGLFKRFAWMMFERGVD